MGQLAGLLGPHARDLEAAKGRVTIDEVEAHDTTYVDIRKNTPAH